MTKGTQYMLIFLAIAVLLIAAFVGVGTLVRGST